VLAVTGPHLVHLYDTTVKPCASHDDCNAVTTAFTHNDRLLNNSARSCSSHPALIGMFWGAPLVARELENNTFRLVWTQSVSRTRWLAYKLGLIGAASVAAAGLLSLMVTWWSSPFDAIGQDEREPVLAVVFRPPRSRPHRLCRVRLRARGHLRRAHPPDAACHGGHIRGLHRRAAGRLGMVATPSHDALTVPRPFNRFRWEVDRCRLALNPSDWVITNQTINGAGRVIGENGGFGSATATSAST
jgi:hypothetical protein